MHCLLSLTATHFCELRETIAITAPIKQKDAPMITRRQFIATSTLSLAASCVPAILQAATKQQTKFDQPLGLQLFAIRAELTKDFNGTLHRVAAMGFKEIEFAGYFGKTAQELKSVADSLNLRCISGHHGGADLETRSDEILDFANTLGLQCIVCSTPKSLNAENKKLPWNELMHSFTPDDWKANAEIFNRFGEKARKRNIQFAYHNYCTEFRPQGDFVPYDELMRLTDKQFVKIQLDCGWAEAASVSSLALLRKYKDRVVSLHLKDLKTKPDTVKPEATPNVPLGKGIIDWTTLLQQAVDSGINHYFLEHEPPYVEPIFDSLAASIKYLSNIMPTS
jgi:sugar phosphate isomerase/epimerase